MHHKLIAKSLHEDPRLEEAKKLLLSALLEAQKKITGVQPKCKECSVEYEEILKAFQEVRGAPLYYPYVGSGIGNGALVELLDGSIKYDFICGIGPYYLGHSHPGLLETGIDSALSNTVMQGNLQQNIDPLELMQKLLDASGLNHCFLSSSGATATENGLKVAFHYKKHATRVLAFEGCFMGRTLALAQITDKAAYRVGLPNTLPVDYVPFTPENPEIALKVLKKHLQRYPGLHGAMCFELIQGEGGFNVGSKAFFEPLMKALKESDIPIIIDEIQTFGRTPKLFAFQYFDLSEYVDIVCIGKLSQVCATLYSKRVTPGMGLLGQTFTASTSAIKAGLYILDKLLKENNNHKVFEQCQKLFKTLKGDIQGFCGLGSMVAFVVHGGDYEKTTRFAKDLFDEGLITFTAGSNPMKIRMLIPAPVLKEHDLEQAFNIIQKVLNKA